MATQLTPEQLRAMFHGQNKGIVWTEACRLYYKLQVHADGEVPIWLIKKARPNESLEVQRYRENIYEPETQNPVEVVISIFEKIRRSPDFMIRFNDDVPTIIADDEIPEKYLTEKYPVYGSIEDWLFEEGLRTQALDANAVIAVMPYDLKEANVAISNNEYIKPVARVFNCPAVVQFVPEDYAVLKIDELSSLLSPEMQQSRLYAMNPGIDENYDKIRYPAFHRGQVYYLITADFYMKWEETKEGKYIATELFMHGLGELPVFQVPGKFVKRYANNTLKKSILAPMVPHLNKAARESNDLDAGVIMHLFIQRWIINNRECRTCHNTGRVPCADGPPTTCKDCGGSGWAKGKNPFEDIEVNPTKLNLNGFQLPIPPVGEIQKNPEIIKIANERVEQHLYKSLCAVNMQNTMQTPLNQSGTAKEWDHDAENNTVYSGAEGLIYIANKTIYFINELRYKTLVPDEDERKKMLPHIPVPEKFDITNTSFLLSEYQTAKTSGLNAIVLSEMQREIAQKKFYANPRVSDFVETVMNMDPFPDKTIEEKALMMSNKMATDIDVIMSVYISDFVKQAMEEDDTFNEKSIQEKRDILEKMAQDKLDELTPAKQLVTDILGNNSIPAAGVAPGAAQNGNATTTGPQQSGNGQLNMPPLRGNGMQPQNKSFGVGNKAVNVKPSQ